MQFAGEERTGSASLRDDGKAVQFHEVLIDEHAVAFIHVAVAVDELADTDAEALELAVDVRGEGGEDPGQMKELVRIPGQHLGSVHVQQIGHEGRIIIQKNRIHVTELLAENILMNARQARRQSLNVQVNDLIFQRAAGAVRLGDDRVQFVELKYLGKIVQLAGKGHQGEARQVLVFEHVVVKGGQQLAPFHQWIIFIFLIGFDKAETDMDGVQKALETVQVADGNRFGQRRGILPGQPVFAENLLPFYHPRFL